MGYDTFYSMRVEGLSEKAFNGPNQDAARAELRSIVEELIAIDQATGSDRAGCVFDEYGGCSGEYINAWNGEGLEEVFIELSKRHPEYHFTVYADGETKEDFRKFTVQDGKAKWHDSTIVYDEGTDYEPEPKSCFAPG